MEKIPVHILPEMEANLPELQIFRFKNTPQMPGSQPMMQLPVTPLPTDLPHRHSYCEILFFVEGEGFHEIDFHSYSIKAPGIHFVAPGKVHLLTPTSDCKGYIITFPENYYAFYGLTRDALPAIASYFDKAGSAPIVNLDASAHTYFRNLLENMLSDYFEKGTDKNTALAAYMHIFISKCMDVAGGGRTTPDFSPGDISSRFQELVERHFRELRSVQQYADMLSVTTDYLGRAVKKSLGITTSEYLLEKALLEAKRLLVFTNMTGKEIAYHLHIDDPSYFSRIFKRKTGLSPHEYRISMRKSTNN